jgi:small subunit ribosomal protein S13e
MMAYIAQRTGLAPELPEDLYHLIKKAVAVRKHLEKNRHDKGKSFPPSVSIVRPNRQIAQIENLGVWRCFRLRRQS